MWGGGRGGEGEGARGVYARGSGATILFRGRNSHESKDPESVQTRCIVNGEAQKSPLSGDYLGVFDVLSSACSLRAPLEKPFKIHKLTGFYKHPL